MQNKGVTVTEKLTLLRFWLTESVQRLHTEARFDRTCRRTNQVTMSNLPLPPEVIKGPRWSKRYLLDNSKEIGDFRH